LATAQPEKTVITNAQSATAIGVADASTASDQPELGANETGSAGFVSELEKNTVKRVVDELVLLMGHIHDSKQELIARGIPFHTVNVLVELGAQGKAEEQARIVQTALESSRNQYGPAAITAEDLDIHLKKLVALEKDMGHARQVGRQQGLDLSSINSLTLIIRQNPGDGGEKTINTFLAYAMACDIQLHRIDEIRESITAGPKSVLPDIARDESDNIRSKEKKKLITDIVLGCVLALLAFTLLT